MKYFVTTLAAAQALAQPLEMATGISAIKAKQEGCEGVTAFWWPLIIHPDGQQVAICIPDEFQRGYGTRQDHLNALGFTPQNIAARLAAL